MPLGLQIYTIRKILERANPNLNEMQAAHGLEGSDELPTTSPGGREGDTRCWVDSVDPNLSLEDNLDSLKQEFPLFKWEVPKKAKNKPLRDKGEIEEREDSAIIRQERLVEPHDVKSKGKPYGRARMQIGVNKWLKGKYAIVQIYVPNVHVDTERMSDARESHYAYQHDFQWVKLIDNRNVRPKKRKEVIPDEEGVLIRTEIIIKPQNQISLDDSLTGQYALVLVSIPKSHALVEGMPHVLTNKYLEPVLKLAQLERFSKKGPPRSKLKREKKSKHTYSKI